MKVKKLISYLVACTMLAASTAAFAAAPSEYDGQPYSNVGYTSDDPDGEVNLAVIAKGDVNFVGDTMYVKGSVYSDGTIYVGDGSGNKVDGLFVSGVKGMWDYKTPGDAATEDQFRLGYIHVDDNHQMSTNAYSTTLQYEGAILDTETSFECTYEPFAVPEIANNLGDVKMDVYAQGAWNWSAERGSYQEPAVDGPKTITEDTYIENLSMNGSWVDSYHQAMIVDTTAGDVTVVINNMPNAVNPSIQVVGDHEAYIYINNYSALTGLRINKDYNDQWQLDNSGSVEHTHLYINGTDVKFAANQVAVADMNVTADTLEISGSTSFRGNINSNAKTFTIVGGQTEVTGTVCVPEAASRIADSGTLYGQLHTDTLEMNGAGSIIWKADTAAAKNETEPTPEPTEEPAPAPLPGGEEIDLSGLGYAYIFGYEPNVKSVVETDEDGNEVNRVVAEVEMAPTDIVTREQVAAMIMRMIDQKYGTSDAEYPITDNIAEHEGKWYMRGLAYLSSQGAFDTVDSVNTGWITRGEVAKLVVFGLNLSKTADTDFVDIDDSEYKAYIEIMNAYGYMHGMGDNTFKPDSYMTRAEFCSMFNQIIGRDEMGLTAQDGSTVTPELYSIVDLEDGAWYTDIVLKATSAYDEQGLIDVDTRLANIRNVLDKYDAQKWF